MQPIHRTKTIYVRILAGTGKGATVSFPLDRYLADKKITGFETIQNLLLKQAQDGTPIAAQTDNEVATVTLVRQADQIHQEFPLNLADPLLMRGIWKELKPTVIDWQSSFITLNDNPTTATDFSFALLVHYRED